MRWESDPNSPPHTEWFLAGAEGVEEPVKKEFWSSRLLLRVLTGVSTVCVLVPRRWARCSGVKTLARRLGPAPLPPDRCLITSSACYRMVSTLTLQKSRSLSSMDMWQNSSGAMQSRTSERVSLSRLQNTEVRKICVLGRVEKGRRSNSSGLLERRSRLRNSAGGRSKERARRCRQDPDLRVNVQGLDEGFLH